MADDNDENSPAPSGGGELIPRGAPLPAQTAKGRTIGRLLSMLSIWPFRNKAFVRSLETAQEVVEKQDKLEETVIQHGRTRGRLNDLGITLAQDRLQRRREFIEEGAKFSAALNDSILAGEMLDEKNEVARMKVEKEKAQLQKDIDDLKPPPPPPPEPPKTKTTRGRSPKQKKREEVITKYEREIARIEASKKTEKAKATLKKAAEAEKEEELQKIENMP